MEALEDETEMFERICEDAARKEAEFKREWAKSYLSAKGPVKERESWATWQVAEYHEAMTISEGLMRAKRERLTSLRTMLDSLRTLAANVRNLT